MRRQTVISICHHSVYSQLWIGEFDSMGYLNTISAADKSAGQGMVPPMRHSISRLSSPRVSPPNDSQNRSVPQANDFFAPVSSRLDSRKVLSIGDQKPASEEHLEELLSTMLPSQDSELAHIVVAMVQMSKTLKINGRNVQTLSDALKRVVQCAVKQCLLDRELRSLALADDLTGLYNRRAFLTLASQQLKLSRR